MYGSRQNGLLYVSLSSLGTDDFYLIVINFTLDAFIVRSVSIPHILHAQKTQQAEGTCQVWMALR